MRVAIAILNWNGLELLQKFLPRVVEFSETAKVYLVDNHSNDASVEFVQNEFPTVRIIRFDENYGYAKGYNLAIKEIEEEMICCLNSDVEVRENWLNPIVELFQKDEKIAAIQPKILNYKKPTYFEYAGAAGGFLDKFGYPYCRGRIFWTLEEDKGQFNDEQEIFWASGACLFVKKEAFLSIGGFDEDFFAHQEEIDLCWRLKNVGYKIYYTSKSTVYHVGGATLKGNSHKKTFLNFRNNLLMLAKNLPATSLFPIIFIRLCLDGITAFVFLRYEGFQHFLAIARAHFGFYALLPKFLQKRSKTIQKYYLHNNTPLQYFVKKRERFGELR